MPLLTPEVLLEFLKVAGLIFGFATVIIQNSRQHKLTNSRMNELVAVTKSAATAAGKLEGIAEVEARPKALVAEIVGEIAVLGKPTQDVTGEIAGELYPTKESKTRQKKLTAVKKKRKP